MVIIFSQRNDYSTDQVIDYLINNKIEFRRINGEDFFEERERNSYDSIDKKIHSIWFRRSYNINLLKQKLIPDFVKLNSFIKREMWFAYRENVKNFYDSKDCTLKLSSLDNASLNKLDVLKLAKEYGIDYPKYSICSSLKELTAKFKDVSYLITKPMGEIFSYYAEHYYYVPYTKKLNFLELEKILPNHFLPSFFQEYIEKEFEIRSVFLVDKFYSMAIFSSKNNKTREDFRNYDLKNPNRNIPFVLPEIIKEKLLLLINRLKLNFCSVDILYSKNKYYLLEINPVGQFGMTSLPCNYKIESKIAKLLRT